MDKAVIIDGLRTPFGKLGGTLKDESSVDLGAFTIRRLIERNSLQKEEVSHVFMGHVLPTDGMTPTRLAVLRSDMPIETISLSFDRACCSAMSAIGMMRQNLLLGEGSVGIAGGMENMSQTPYLVPQLRWGQRLGDVSVEDPLVMRNEFLKEPRVIYVGQSALKYGVDRQIQDEWALRSQQNWQFAQENNHFDQEVVPYEYEERGEKKVFAEDEYPRKNSSMEKLSNLKTVYDSPTITPGNASGINDGAAAVLMMSETEAKRRNIEPLAVIERYMAVSGDPKFSCSLPGEAISKLLHEEGLNINDIDLFEINEAYAAMPSVSTKILAEEFDVPWDDLKEKTNVNGGAISIGHPIGASGARITMTLAYELKRRGGGLGIAAICGGIGQADLLLLRVNG